METMLGFPLDIWDYVTFAALFFVTAVGLGAAMFVLGLPGRIAIARNHPDADAVNLMGWVGFAAVVPWIQALIWAFKPTDVIDIRNLPADERRQTVAMIARLKGKRVVPRPSPLRLIKTRRHVGRDPNIIGDPPALPGWQ